MSNKFDNYTIDVRKYCKIYMTQLQAFKPLLKKQSQKDEPSQKQLSGKAIAVSNEEAVLKTLHLFGHLRRTEIAAAVWPHSPKKSGYQMACKTIDRLMAEKSILEKPNSLGQKSLILATKGVRRLANMDIVANTGHDLSCGGSGFYHRTFGSCYLIDRASKQDCSVYGEYAIQKDWSPLKVEYAMQKFKKYPDGLVIYDGKEHGLRDGFKLADWIEVELAFKSYPEVEKAFNIFTKDQSLNPSGTVMLNRLIFLVDSRTPHAGRLAGYLKKYLYEHPALSPQVFLSHIFIAKADISYPLAWNSSEEVSIKDVKTKNGFDLEELDKDF